MSATCCPYCGRTNDQHSGKDPNDVPAAGDMSICWRCHNLAVFDDGPDGLVTRKPTPEELERLVPDPELRRALGALAESYTVTAALDLWRLS